MKIRQSKLRAAEPKDETPGGVPLSSMNHKTLKMTAFSRFLLYRHSFHNREFHNVNCRFCGTVHSVNWAWKGYCVTNKKRGTKLHEEKSIQGSIALHIASLCRILIFRNVLWISDAEHGISMLDKYQNVGWKKFYLIYGMCDETFSVNCTTEVPEGVDQGWFMFSVPK